MRPLTGWLGLSLIFVASPSCKSQAERELGAEVAQMALLVNALRNAPHNQKDSALQALSTHVCVQASACELKQVCLQAYQLHQKATQATQRVREVLREGEGDPVGASQLLELSEAELGRARSLTNRCVELQGELERATQ